LGHGVDCLGPSLAISSPFTLEVCVVAKIANKIGKNSLFEGLRSFKVIDVDKSKQLVTSACYDMQQVCTYLQLF